ncbi:hypothetical protein AVEN_264871-1 [Araneus ventricosus]|uniref:Uncharacterized protein n=1 Tax=Araneus ventricosus TaxID=182803 RepID=A0A4Y2GRG4_ARAVE|nr:hypothetical protein AVEN_264871-1 [Araneus ventricosus]
MAEPISHQFHLLLRSPDGSTTTPKATQLSQFKVYDTFHSAKSVMHFIAQKSACACAQTIGAAICAYARSTRKCNYRFHDIQIISNKLGVAPVVHRAAASYSDVYKSVSNSGQGNSICLVVKIRDSGSKVLNYALLHCPLAAGIVEHVFLE